MPNLSNCIHFALVQAVTKLMFYFYMRKLLLKFFSINEKINFV